MKHLKKEIVTSNAENTKKHFLKYGETIAAIHKKNGRQAKGEIK